MLPNWLLGKSKSKLRQELGGASTAYTAGDGIDISNGVISFDPTSADSIPQSKIENLATSLESKANLTQISNPNLLDNPWFTVNQRGKSSYTTSVGVQSYCVDRWIIQDPNTVDVVDDGLEITQGSYTRIIAQRISELSNISGRTVTISIIIDDTLYTHTDIIPSDTSAMWDIDGIAHALLPNGDLFSLDIFKAESASFYLVRLFNDDTAWSTSHTVRAIKLELGSVSTLAMDTAPNYATELLKCQRYFYRLNSTGNNDWIAMGKSWATNEVNVIVDLPPMRTLPSVTASDLSALLIAKGASSLDPHRISAVHTAYFKEYGHSIVLTLDLADNTATDGEAYVLKSDSVVNIDFSADL